MKRYNFLIILLFILLPISIFSQSTFKAETLSEAISKYVEKNNGCKSNVEIIQSLRDIKFKHSNVRASVTHSDTLAGLCKITLNFLLNNELIHKEDIRIKVRLYAEVPVSKRFIKKDDIINSDDIGISIAEVTNISPSAVVEINDAVGKVSRKGIAKGAVVQYSDIVSGSEANINKNDKVKLLHYSGSICIKSNGFALESGRAGDVIKIKSDNNQTLYGFIADDGNVIIEDKNLLTTK